MSTTIRRRLVFVAAGLLVLLAGQNIWLAFADAALQQNRIRSENARLNQQVASLSEELREVRIRLGEIWAGDLGGAIASEAAMTDPQVDALPYQKHISGTVPLADDSQLQAAIELHECTPGSPTCTSGGTLSILDRNGRTLCTGPVSLLAANGSRYELEWAKEARELPETQKQKTIKSAVGEAGAVEPDLFRSLLANLYAAECQADSSLALRFKQQLVKAILSKALQDRALAF